MQTIDIGEFKRRTRSSTTTKVKQPFLYSPEPIPVRGFKTPSRGKKEIVKKATTAKKTKFSPSSVSVRSDEVTECDERVEDSVQEEEEEDLLFEDGEVEVIQEDEILHDKAPSAFSRVILTIIAGAILLCILFTSGPAKNGVIPDELNHIQQDMKESLLTADALANMDINHAQSAEIMNGIAQDEVAKKEEKKDVTKKEEVSKKEEVGKVEEVGKKEEVTKKEDVTKKELHIPNSLHITPVPKKEASDVNDRFNRAQVTAAAVYSEVKKSVLEAKELEVKNDASTEKYIPNKARVHSAALERMKAARIVPDARDRADRDRVDRDRADRDRADRERADAARRQKTSFSEAAKKAASERANLSQQNLDRQRLMEDRNKNLHKESAADIIARRRQKLSEKMK